MNAVKTASGYKPKPNAAPKCTIVWTASDLYGKRAYSDLGATTKLGAVLLISSATKEESTCRADELEAMARGLCRAPKELRNYRSIRRVTSDVSNEFYWFF